MQIESLEPRRLLSTSLNATTGALTITGTAGNDKIFVTRGTLGRLIVTETAKTAQGVFTTTRTAFAGTKVKSLVVNAGNGNDLIDLAGDHVRPIVFVPATVNGGAGNDTVWGTWGRDVINGNDGNDDLHGLGANDLINGNDGNDRLTGGLGADTLNGGAGNDFIDARDGSGTDVVDGGANATPTLGHPGDTALVNKGDAVSNVEQKLL